MESRILYLDIHRTLAIFAVITLHICAQGFLTTPISQNSEWHILNFYESLTHWAVPLFVMVSGTIFLDPQKHIRPSKLYQKNILRIVVALLFWGILYNSIHIVNTSFAEGGGADVFFIEISKQIIHFIFRPAWYHLWFLYMIIGLYILVPLIRVFTKSAKKEHYHYLFLIYFFTGSLLPFAQNFLSLFNEKLKFYFEIKEVLGYTCFFILGYYLSKFELQQRTKKWIYILAGLSIILQILGTALISYKIGSTYKLLYKAYTPNIFIQSIAVYLFIKDFAQRKFFNNHQKLILRLSKYSFGIYLVHDIFNIIFVKIGFTATYFSPIFAIPLRAAITFFLSFFIIYILDKIPFIRKYCM